MNMIVCPDCGWMDTAILIEKCTECGADLNDAEVVDPREFVDNGDGTFSAPNQ